MDSETDAEQAGSDAGSTRATSSVGLAVSVVGAILGFVGSLADVSALIDKVGDDGLFSLVPVVIAVATIAVIAAVIGLAWHYQILTPARLRWAAPVIVSACAGFLIGHFLAGAEPQQLEPKQLEPNPSGSPVESVLVPPPSSSDRASISPVIPPSTPGPFTADNSPTRAPTTPARPKSTTKAFSPPPRITTTGAILAPAAESGVQKCAYVTGTARLAVGKTLVLAVRNLDNDESDRWYVEFPRGWKDPSTMSTWRGVEYFPGDNGQHYEIGLFAVDLNTAVAAHAAGQNASDNLVRGAAPLDTRRVVQREGGSGSDCD